VRPRTWWTALLAIRPRRRFSVGSRMERCHSIRSIHPICSALPNRRNIRGDLRIGAVDAAVDAMAERLGVSRIATSDHRHFAVVRPAHLAHFELLPYDPLTSSVRWVQYGAHLRQPGQWAGSVAHQRNRIAHHHMTPDGRGTRPEQAEGNGPASAGRLWLVFPTGEPRA